MALQTVSEPVLQYPLYNWVRGEPRHVLAREQGVLFPTRS